MSDEMALVPSGENEQDMEGRLTSLVLDGVTSANSRRAYAAGLRQFFAWTRGQTPRPFSKPLVRVRVGNWLVREQASELLNAPDPKMRVGYVIAPSSRCSSAAVCVAQRS